ncbi:MAG TPA: hypothetical protein VHB02_05330 [Acidimicrobiales bacterium]|nr:hypothetical protein [Acidimicrobiales bacterium]
MRGRSPKRSTLWRAVAGAAGGAVAVGALGFAPTAGAEYHNGDRTVGLWVTWKDVPKDTVIKFRDVTGNCDKDKKFPSFTTYRASQTTFDHLFVAKATGSCAFDATNARFHVSMTAPTSAEASVIVLIAQPRAGASYGAYCDRPEGVTCVGGGEVDADSRSLSVSMTIGPITRQAAPPEAGYTFCAVEGQYCVGKGKATVAFGAGDRQEYAYGPSTPWGGESRTECVAKSFGTRDPAPGRRKACFIKA